MNTHQTGIFLREPGGSHESPDWLINVFVRVSTATRPAGLENPQHPPCLTSRATGVVVSSLWIHRLRLPRGLPTATDLLGFPRCHCRSRWRSSFGNTRMPNQGAMSNSTDPILPWDMFDINISFRGFLKLGYDGNRTTPCGIHSRGSYDETHGTTTKEETDPR